MLFLQAEDPEKIFSCTFNFAGRSITAGFAIYDTMQFVEAGTWVTTSWDKQPSPLRRFYCVGRRAEKAPLRCPNARI